MVLKRLALETGTISTDLGRKWRRSTAAFVQFSGDQGGVRPASLRSVQPPEAGSGRLHDSRAIGGEGEDLLVPAIPHQQISKRYRPGRLTWGIGRGSSTRFFLGCCSKTTAIAAR